MTPDQYQRVKAVFQTVRELPKEQRGAVLERELAGDDEVVAREVRRMLARDHPDDGFLEEGVIAATTGRRPAGPTPERIGQYTIVDRIGAGGMGVVYQARQERPNRMVAVKLIHPGAVSPRSLARFEHEAEILGRLKHPGIAQIYESGTDDTGGGEQPFFAMELIEGRPLDEHVEAGALSIPARIELMILVCDAVHHAHQKGVIHRDLKPGNVLVQEAAGGRSTHGSRSGAVRAQPRILDFGLARLDDDRPDARRQTVPGEFMGTLAYASPEQVAGRTDEIDTRSDVYALGMMLFEVVTGTLPFDCDAPLGEVVRRITEDDPKRPSSIRPGIDVDLETIILKTLAKDPDRRYGSAVALQEDLERYMDGLPIAARADSRLYVLGKTLRRHRAIVTAAVLLALALVAGLITTTWQAGVAREERAAAQQAEQEARDEAARANAVLDSVRSMLTAVDPARDGRDVTVYETLDRAEAGLHADPAEIPGVGASIHEFMAIAYHALGEFDRAARHTERAMEYAAVAHSDEPERYLTFYANLGTMYMEAERFREAVALEQEVLPRLRRELGPEHPVTLAVMNVVAGGYLRLGEDQEAAERFREVLELRERTLGADHAHTLSVKQNLASVLERLGRIDDAAPLMRDALDSLTRMHGTRDPRVLRAMNNFAFILEAQHELDEALALRQQVLELRRVVLGPDHPGTLTAMNNLGLTLRQAERYAEAVDVLRETAALRRTVLGEDHPRTLSTLSNLALSLHDLGDVVEADATIRDVLERRREVLGGDHPSTAHSMELLGQICREQGRPADAEPLLRDALSCYRARLGDAHRRTIAATTLLASALDDLDRRDEARSLLVAARATVLAEQGPDDPAARALETALESIGPGPD